MTERQVSLAEAFEDIIQAPRLEKLAGLFGHASQIVFSSQDFTLQNRALLATSQGGLLEFLGTGGVDSGFMEALGEAKQTVERICGGTIDLCPKGIKSTKYAYDGTLH